MIERAGNLLRLSGPLRFDTVPGLLQAADSLLDASVDAIDLSQATAVDSAALGLLFKWQRQQAARGRRLAFVHAPKELLALADLYGVADWFSPAA